jgi:ParB-like chromosome segregation protein Spo0J
MSKLEITELAVNELIPYVNNARTHSDEQIAQIAASIREFGWTNPILVDGDKGIIAGHGRLAAARKLKMDAVPAIQLDGLSEAQKKALILADNKLALNSGWDMDLLSVEFEQIKNMGFDVEVIGFTSDEIKQFSIDAEEIDLPDLPDGEKQPFQQKTFTLHDEQAQIVDDAITLARTDPLSDTGLNENTNGNALALICQQWLAKKNDE